MAWALPSFFPKTIDQSSPGQDALQEAKTLTEHLKVENSAKDRLIKAAFDSSFTVRAVSATDATCFDLQVEGVWPALDDMFGMAMDGCKLSSRMAAEDWDVLVKQIACVVSNATDSAPAPCLRVKFVSLGGKHFFGDIYFVPSCSNPELFFQGQSLLLCALNKTKTFPFSASNSTSSFSLQRTTSQNTESASDYSATVRTETENSGYTGASTGESGSRDQRYKAWQIKDEPDIQAEATNAATQGSKSTPRNPATKPLQPTFSLHSAPTVLERMHSTKLAGTCEDCLRPDCVAWLEGNPLPQPLGELKAGQKVLCHDYMTHGMKYAEITNVVIEDGSSAEWVKVILEDGTMLEMTANHPTQPADLYGQNGTCPAGQLQEGIDYLMVLKTMPVLVKEVRQLTKELLEEDKVKDERVYLTLKQPERHAVFVAPPGTAGGIAEVHTMAVGSADVQTGSAHKLMTVKNTFLEPAYSEEVSTAKKRSSSVPRSFKLHSFLLSRHKSASEISSSHHSALSSGQSEMSNGFETVLVAPPLQVSPNMGPHRYTEYSASYRPSQQVAISELLNTRRNGLSSIGSALHATHQCIPCLFHSRALHEGGYACWKGSFCERCHEDHTPQARKKAKSGRVRARLKFLKQKEEEEEIAIICD